MAQCPSCYGSGSKTCPDCNGIGNKSGETCYTCHASGRVSCSTCYGTGNVADGSSGGGSSSSGSSGGGGGGGPSQNIIKARELYKNGKYDVCIRLCSDVIKLYEDDPQLNHRNAAYYSEANSAYQFRAFCYDEKGNYRNAIDDYSAVIAYISADKESYYRVLRAEDYEKEGYRKAAIDDYRYAVNYGNNEDANKAADALRRLGIKNWTFKNHAVLCVLSTLLGWLGIDRFYAGRKLLGILKIVVFVTAWWILSKFFGVSQKTASGALLIVGGMFGWWIIDSIQALLGLQRAMLNKYRIRSDSKTASIVVTVIFAAVMSFFTFLVIAGLIEQADERQGTMFVPTTKKQKEYAALYPAGTVVVADNNVEKNAASDYYGRLFSEASSDSPAIRGLKNGEKLTLTGEVLFDNRWRAGVDETWLQVNDNGTLGWIFMMDLVRSYWNEKK